MEHQSNFKSAFISVKIVVLLVSFFMIESCQDSLGVEENIKKTLIDSTKKKDTLNPINKVYIKIDSLFVSGSEFIEFNGMPKDTFSIIWQPYSVKTTGKIDTSDVIPNIWLNLSFSLSTIDSAYLRLDERIVEIMIKIDSLPIAGKHFLNESISSGRWSSIITKFQNTSNENIYEGSQSPITVEFFENLRFPSYGIISLRINGRLMLDRQQTISNIKGLVRIMYFF